MKLNNKLGLKNNSKINNKKSIKIIGGGQNNPSTVPRISPPPLNVTLHSRNVTPGNGAIPSTVAQRRKKAAENAINAAERRKERVRLEASKRENRKAATVPSPLPTSSPSTSDARKVENNKQLPSRATPESALVASSELVNPVIEKKQKTISASNPSNSSSSSRVAETIMKPVKTTAELATAKPSTKIAANKNTLLTVGNPASASGTALPGAVTPKLPPKLLPPPPSPKSLDRNTHIIQKSAYFEKTPEKQRELIEIEKKKQEKQMKAKNNNKKRKNNNLQRRLIPEGKREAEEAAVTTILPQPSPTKTTILKQNIVTSDTSDTFSPFHSSNSSNSTNLNEYYKSHINKRNKINKKSYSKILKNKNIKNVKNTKPRNTKNKGIYDFSNRNYTGIEPFIFSSRVEINELNLSNNQITKIMNNTFWGLSSLKKLNLSNNHISDIEKDALFPLKKLQELNLSSNNLGGIYYSSLTEDTFKGMSSLQILNLSSNNLKYIDKLFNNQSLSNLETLDLSNNKITEIKKDTFSVLKNLKKLVLTGNRISKIDNDTKKFLLSLLQENVNSVEMDDKNLLYKQTPSPSNPSNPPSSPSREAESRIIPVKITKPENNDNENRENKPLLKGFRDSQNINQENYNQYYKSHINKRNKINKKSYSKILTHENLRSTRHNGGLYNFSNRNYTGIDPGIFSSDSIIGLNISNNQITKIMNKTFIGANNLEKLNLSDNNINYIEKDAFVTLKKLQELDLSSNKLGGNLYSTLTEDTFKGMPILQILNLSSNNLKNIDNLFNNQSLSKLETLDLSNNKITKIKKDTFSVLKNLKKLVLTGNSISKIDNGTKEFLLSLLQKNVNSVEMDNKNLLYEQTTSPSSSSSSWSYPTFKSFSPKTSKYIPLPSSNETLSRKINPGKSKKEMIHNLINTNDYFNDCVNSQTFTNSGKRKSIKQIIDESIDLNDPNKKYIINNIISNILNKKKISDTNFEIMKRIIIKYNNETHTKFVSIMYIIINKLFLYKIENKRKELLNFIKNKNFSEYINFYENNSITYTKSKSTVTETVNLPKGEYSGEIKNSINQNNSTKLLDQPLISKNVNASLINYNNVSKLTSQKLEMPPKINNLTQTLKSQQ